jgi:hypothetical protein
VAETLQISADQLVKILSMRMHVDAFQFIYTYFGHHITVYAVGISIHLKEKKKKNKVVNLKERQEKLQQQRKKNTD